MNPTGHSERQEVILVASRFLGGQTFSAGLEAVLRTFAEISLDVVSIDPSSPEFESQPWPIRASDRLNSIFGSAALIRPWQARFRNPNTVVWFAGEEAAQAACLFGRRPDRYILSTDSTPSLASRRHSLSVDATGLRGRLASFAADLLISAPSRKAYGSAAAIVARTPTVENELRTRYGIPIERTMVSYMPLDCEVWAPRTPWEQSVQRPKILFCGNDIVRKGLPLLVDAYQRHLSDVAELVIVSRDRRARQFQDCEGITVVDDQSHDRVGDLVQLYRCAEVFAFPSTGDMLGLAILEAMACGLPVVATQSVAQGDVIRNGVTGRLMAQGASADDWGRVLRETILDADLRHRMGASARDFIVKNSSSQSFARVAKRALALADVSIAV